MYEKQRARYLLTTNMLLRRDAEITGDVLNEELLHNLETYLLDIAHIRENETNTEVTSIKNRIQQNEILLVLHIHNN